MIITDCLDLNEPVELSKEEERMIDEAFASPPTFDEDCPPLSKEVMQRMLERKKNAV